MVYPDGKQAPGFPYRDRFFHRYPCDRPPPRPPRGAPGARRRVFAAWKGLLEPRIPARPRFAGWRRAGAAADCNFESGWLRFASAARVLARVLYLRRHCRASASVARPHRGVVHDGRQHAPGPHRRRQGVRGTPRARRRRYVPGRGSLGGAGRLCTRAAARIVGRARGWGGVPSLGVGGRARGARRAVWCARGAARRGALPPAGAPKRVRRQLPRGARRCAPRQRLKRSDGGQIHLGVLCSAGEGRKARVK